MEHSNRQHSKKEPQDSGGSAATSEPVRIERIAQFLPALERDALYQAACANETLFHPPGGPGTEAGGTLHWALDACDNEPEASPLSEAIEILGKRILDRLPSLFTALGVAPFPVSKAPLGLIHGLDGHSGLAHADSTDGRFEISLLYYFHRVPKAFRGGDLEIYESVPDSVSGHSDKAIATIENEDNLLVAFHSKTFHKVTGVSCDSDDFADGRFVAVGFLGAQ